MEHIVYYRDDLVEQVKAILDVDRGTANNLIPITLLFNTDEIPEEPLNNPFDVDEQLAYISLTINTGDLSPAECDRLFSYREDGSNVLGIRNIRKVSIAYYSGTTIGQIFSRDDLESHSALNQAEILSAPNLTSAIRTFAWTTAMRTVSIDGVPNLKICRGLFYTCYGNFTLNIPALEDATEMFGAASALRIDLSNCGSPIIGRRMFRYCYNLIEIIGSDFSKVTDAHRMFEGSTLPATKTPWHSFISVIDASYMFANCRNIYRADITYMENVTNWYGIFNYCSNLEEIYASKSLSNWFFFKNGSYGISDDDSSPFVFSKTGKTDLYITINPDEDCKEEGMKTFFSNLSSYNGSGIAYEHIIFQQITEYDGSPIVFRDFLSKFNSNRDEVTIDYRDAGSLSFFIACRRMTELYFHDREEVGSHLNVILTGIKDFFEIRYHSYASINYKIYKVSFENNEYLNILHYGGRVGGYTQVIYLDKNILPPSVNSIGKSIGTFCRTLPDMSETTITDFSGAFSGGDFEEFPKLPKTAKYFNRAFSSVDAIREVVLPSGVEIESADGMFENCSNLTSITIESSSIKSANRMFYQCDNLRTINAPNAFKNTENASEMFYRCTLLPSFDFSLMPNLINANDMFSCPSAVPNRITEVTNFSALKKLKNARGMFANCTYLTSVKDFFYKDSVDYTDIFKNTQKVNIYFTSIIPSQSKRAPQSLVFIEPEDDKFSVKVYDTLFYGEGLKLKMQFYALKGELSFIGESQELLADDKIDEDVLKNLLIKKYRFGEEDGEPSGNLIVRGADPAKINSNIVHISDEELDSFFEKEKNLSKES